MIETPWLWNKGIAALCDHRLPDDYPQGKYSCHCDSSSRSKGSFYMALPDRVSAGDLLWVKVDWLPFFVSNILPDIDEPFVLVTGDSDHSMPSVMPEESECIQVSSRVIHWFTQNFDGTATDKISPLPIGMDFHTLQRQEFWGIRQLPVTKQNEVLEMVQKKLQPVAGRQRKLYIDSQFSGRKDPHRAGAINELARSDLFRLIHADPAVHIQAHFLPQFEMWMQRGQFSHVLSHHGNGLDCHRSWEALILGHVLVVQKSSLDPLYKELPVIIVDDWREVKDISSSEMLLVDSSKEFRREKLTNSYWIDKMRKCAELFLHEKEGV